MKKIYKYILNVSNYQEIKLPFGYEILTIQNQNENPCLWCLVNPENSATETCSIEIFGTGHEINDDMGTERKYISTFQLNNGNLVFHAFHYTGI